MSRRTSRAPTITCAADGRREGARELEVFEQGGGVHWCAWRGWIGGIVSGRRTEAGVLISWLTCPISEKREKRAEDPLRAMTRAGQRPKSWNGNGPSFAHHRSEHEAALDRLPLHLRPPPLELVHRLQVPQAGARCKIEE